MEQDSSPTVQNDEDCDLGITVIHSNAKCLKLIKDYFCLE